MSSFSSFVAQSIGHFAEKQVLLAYKSDPNFFVFKRYEPYKRIGKPDSKGVFRAINQGKSGCDFSFFTQSGKSGLFELKSRKGTRISKSSLDEAQRRDLTLMEEMGFFSFVLVNLRDKESLWFVVPWSLWDMGQKKSHNLKDLQTIGKQCPLNKRGHPLFFDCLP